MHGYYINLASPIDWLENFSHFNITHFMKTKYNSSCKEPMSLFSDAYLKTWKIRRKYQIFCNDLQAFARGTKNSKSIL